MNRIWCLGAALALLGCGQGDQPSAPQTRQETAPAPTADLRAQTATAEGPVCDDPEVVEFVVDAFNTSQDLETRSGVSLETVAAINEVGAARYAEGEWRQVRRCAGKAQLTNGETIDAWHEIRLPRVDDAIGYRVKICTAKYDPISNGDCAKFATSPKN